MEAKDRELHRIATTATIYKDGKYLIAKRAAHKKAFPNKWHVPGGGLEIDDYIHQKPTTSAGQWYGALKNTLKREVREETSLEIEDPEYLMDITFIRSDGIPVLVLSYFAQYKSGEVVLDVHNSDYKWVTVEEAKGYDFIEGIWEQIEMVDTIIKSRLK